MHCFENTLLRKCTFANLHYCENTLLRKHCIAKIHLCENALLRKYISAKVHFAKIHVCESSSDIRLYSLRTRSSLLRFDIGKPSFKVSEPIWGSIVLLKYSAPPCVFVKKQFFFCWFLTLIIYRELRVYTVTVFDRSGNDARSNPFRRHAFHMFLQSEVMIALWHTRNSRFLARVLAKQGNLCIR